MWYVLVCIGKSIAYYGPYENEKEADNDNEKLDGTVVFIKDMDSYAKVVNASIMNKYDSEYSEVY